MNLHRPVPGIAAAAALGFVVAGCAGSSKPSQSTTGISGKRQYHAVRIDSPEPAANGRWGERLAAADGAGGKGDLDGDGVPDLFVGQPRYSSPKARNVGRVWAVSGKTGNVLYKVDSPEPQQDSQFGSFISVLGDVDGDGIPDIAAGTDAQEVNGQKGQGAVWVLSGASGKTLYRLDNPLPQANARFGSRIGRAGDVTGDGVPDVIVGAPANDVPAGCGNTNPAPGDCHKDQGQAFIFDGRTGKLVRTLDLPAQNQQPPSCSAAAGGMGTIGCGEFGLAVQGPGDTNGDGVPDQLVSASTLNGGQGMMFLFSGKDGHLLLTINPPQPQPGALFGFQDAAPLTPGDVNGDGAADLYGNGFLQNGPAGQGQGRAWIFDGKTGKVLYQLDDPTPTKGGQFGWSESAISVKGIPNVYVGQSPHEEPNTPQDGGTYVFNGKTRALLQSLELPPSDRQPAGDNAGPRLGWSLATPGDLNGDGQPDYVAGAPFEDVNQNKDQGAIYVYLSGAAPEKK